MTDIVERLREVRDAEFAYVTDDYKVLTEAADEIERLRAALRRIAVIDDSYSETYVDLRKVGSIAREALGDE